MRAKKFTAVIFVIMIASFMRYVLVTPFIYFNF